MDKLIKNYDFKIDIWGLCGNGKDPYKIWSNNSENAQWSKIRLLRDIDKEVEERMSEKEFFSQYRFYLAFENSLCDFYITEKAYVGVYLNHLAGTIPILYGADPGKSDLPKNSYIRIENFENIGSIVDEMLKLGDPDYSKELEAFYNWQLSVEPVYEIGKELSPFSGSFHVLYATRYYNLLGFQHLCEKLWSEDMVLFENQSVTAVDIKNHYRHCYH